MLVGGELYGRVTPERFDEIAAEWKGRSMTPPTVWIPRDAAALSLGGAQVADAVAAEAARRGLAVNIVRNGTRGMCWLEPLVEVGTPSGRVGYGPVTAADVPGLFDAGFLTGGAHARRVGPVEAIPYFASQQRLTFERVGLTDPTSLDEYLAHGGYDGLQRALAIGPAAIVKEVTDSGLRGRGGAAFPTGIKWKTVLDAPADRKFVTCNADEGDSGTFADRMLMEGDPFTLIEGMTIAAVAVGATQGYIYLRVEYPHARRTLEAAIAAAYARGYLGQNVLGSGLAFDLEVRLGAGAYICGEETSMLESLEGKRGEVRPRPPLPAVKGLFGRPTIVNNVISLASVPIILRRGRGVLPRLRHGQVARHADDSTRRQHQARRAHREGIWRHRLRELLYDLWWRSASGRPIRAVQIGGPLGAYLPESQFDTPLDYEAFTDDRRAGRTRRHRRVRRHRRYGADGPLRDGVLRDRIVRQVHAVPHRLDAWRRGHRSRHTGRSIGMPISRCSTTCAIRCSMDRCAASGGLTPYPVQSAVKYFPQRLSESLSHVFARLQRFRHAAGRIERSDRSRSRSTA